MGLAFTIDSPIKVARFGISSVVSIMSDQLVEDMRKYYGTMYGENHVPIPESEPDFRAKRITAYLNLLDRIVTQQIIVLLFEDFVAGSEISKYFEMLPASAPAKELFIQMTNLAEGSEKMRLQDELRKSIKPGSIDVNIMTKVDKTNYAKTGEALPPEDADAMSALRGYASSDLHSSIIFSAGLNPRLFAYCESFSDFFPDANGYLKKKIILKVSDFRSALIQGKFLAKKGLWVSEFRVESGLNCGGHAFATEGFLMGPILEEFKQKRALLALEMYDICNAALAAKGLPPFAQVPELMVSAQGGVGTSDEHEFLLQQYGLQSIGWGSPFLLVPEATTLDPQTLTQLATAKPEDYYLSNASPLGVLFNNFRNSTADAERRQRIAKGRPGSPCYNKYLSFDTEFTTLPICLASREYQNLKINQINMLELKEEEKTAQIDAVMEKECICNGLTSPAYLAHQLQPPHKLSAVSICPGPNLAYFSDTHSLQEMVAHIYGRKSILNTAQRPHMFINELRLYVEYFQRECNNRHGIVNAKQIAFLKRFQENLLSGIAYYRSLAPDMLENDGSRAKFLNQLCDYETELAGHAMA